MCIRDRLLTAVGDVDDGRHVLLAPVDGVGEAADEHQYGIGIGLEPVSYTHLGFGLGCQYL